MLFQTSFVSPDTIVDADEGVDREMNVVRFVIHSRLMLWVDRLLEALSSY